MEQDGLDQHCRGATAETTTMTSQGQTPLERYALIILGNSGVGKSFLANLFLQKESFVHQTSATAVTTVTEFVEHTSANSTYVIFNIPGLVEADQERIETNKQEINKAFEECPNAVVIYVFGTQKGRIRNEDIIAFNALNDAYPFDKKSLVLVVNGIPRHNRKENYVGETIVLLQQMLKTELPKTLCFLDDIDPNNAQEKDQLRMKLIPAVMDAVPKVHEKRHDIRLQADEVNELKNELCRITDEFDQKREELVSQVQQAQQLHDEELEILRQKCTELEEQKSTTSGNWLGDLVKPVFKFSGTLGGAIGGLFSGEDIEKSIDETRDAMGRLADKILN